MESGIIDAVGVWFFAKDTKRYLYLMRNDAKHPDVWALPGGKRQDDETLIECIKRECVEELGTFPQHIKLAPVEQFTTPDEKFQYHTFFCMVEKEFKPVLNHEHLGYAWINAGTMPKFLHPGLYNTVKFDEIQNKIRYLENYISQ